MTRLHHQSHPYTLRHKAVFPKIDQYLLKVKIDLDQNRCSNSPQKYIYNFKREQFSFNWKRQRSTLYKLFENDKSCSFPSVSYTKQADVL